MVYLFNKKYYIKTMTILDILVAPDSILKKKAEVVDSVDGSIRQLMDNMIITMYQDGGIGLAANQVGVLKRVIVMDLQEDDDEGRGKEFYPLFFANPEVIHQSKEVTTKFEGCLSVPNQRIEVTRSESIKVRYLDYNNKQQELMAKGWLARTLQHEIDHLDGKLLIDYLSNLKKDVVLRKLSKYKKVSA